MPRLKSFLRLCGAFVVSPIIACLIIYLVIYIYTYVGVALTDSDKLNEFAFFKGISQSLQAGLLFGFFSYVGYVFGLPLYLIYRVFRCHKITWWIVGGAVSGVFTAYMMTSFQPEMLAIIAGIVGAVSALAFWLIEVRNNPKYQKK